MYRRYIFVSTILYQNQHQLTESMCIHTMSLTLVLHCSQCTYTEIDMHQGSNDSKCCANVR